LECIEHIEEYVSGESFESFSKDRKTFDAVIRNFEIIGEASHHVPEEIRSQYPDIPWQILKDFRNKVAHEYFGVDHAIVWRTIQQRLLPLKPKLQAVLSQANP
jgi:uncharacterized protein with HEPN domain